MPAVNVGIEGEEAVGVIQRAEELTAHLIDPFRIELQVLPRCGVGQHIPANGVCTVFLQRGKRIYGIAQTFRHLVAVLVQHQSRRDDVLVGHLTLDHRVDSMQREEPAAGLIHTL